MLASLRVVFHSDSLFESDSCRRYVACGDPDPIERAHREKRGHRVLEPKLSINELYDSRADQGGAQTRCTSRLRPDLWHHLNKDTPQNWVARLTAVLMHPERSADILTLPVTDMVRGIRRNEGCLQARHKLVYRLLWETRMTLYLWLIKRHDNYAYKTVVGAYARRRC